MASSAKGPCVRVVPILCSRFCRGLHRLRWMSRGEAPGNGTAPGLKHWPLVIPHLPQLLLPRTSKIAPLKGSCSQNPSLDASAAYRPRPVTRWGEHFPGCTAAWNTLCEPKWQQTFRITVCHPYLFSVTSAQPSAMASAKLCC